MSVSVFLRGKRAYLISQSFLAAFVCLFISLFHPSGICYILMLVAFGVATGSSLVAEYLPRKNFYGNAEKTIENLSSKYLLSEVIEKPDFPEGIKMYELLKRCLKSMSDEIGQYKLQQEEYRQYVEMWVHEIKTPIANSQLICKNAPSESSKAIQNELLRIEAYVEQSLFYARSTNVEKDYRIKKVTLDQCVKNAVKKYSRQLISAHCALEMQNMDLFVYTDEKWLEFILGQLISNSVKYRKDPMKLVFSGEEGDNKVVLSVKDNGIGIPLRDQNRIFDKGFTGENGRKLGKSTGMGLFLCRTLCEKLRLQIQVASRMKEGTEICITFPKDRFSLLL